MAKASLKSIAKIMADIDICMFTTSAARGAKASRPMSNNADVDYSGHSYFFALKTTRLVRELRNDKKVGLSFVGSKILKTIYISVSGAAKLIDDRETMIEHWNKDLEIWFKDGVDTKGLVMIEVRAEHIKYWSGRDEGTWSRGS